MKSSESTRHSQRFEDNTVYSLGGIKSFFFFVGILVLHTYLTKCAQRFIALLPISGHRPGLIAWRATQNVACLGHYQHQEVEFLSASTPRDQSIQHAGIQSTSHTVRTGRFAHRLNGGCGV